jgi:hypothetical protein
VARETTNGVTGHTYFKGIGSVVKDSRGPSVLVIVQHRLIAFFLIPDAPHVLQMQVNQRFLNNGFSKATNRATSGR